MQDPQFKAHFKTNYSRLLTYESNKHLPPMFSYALQDIAQYFGLCIECEGKGDCSITAKNNQKKYNTIRDIDSCSSESNRSEGRSHRSQRSLNSIPFIYKTQLSNSINDGNVTTNFRSRKYVHKRISHSIEEMQFQFSNKYSLVNSAATSDKHKRTESENPCKFKHISKLRIRHNYANHESIAPIQERS